MFVQSLKSEEVLAQEEEMRANLNIWISSSNFFLLLFFFKLCDEIALRFGASICMTS